jgi:hypothetical protein
LSTLDPAWQVQQDCAHLRAIGDEVGKRVSIEHGVERFDGIAQNTAQAACRRDRAFGRRRIEARGRQRGPFGAAHDGADVDLRCRLSELQPALCDAASKGV